MAIKKLYTRKTNFISNASEVIARSGLELSKSLLAGEYSTDVRIPEGLRRTTRGLPIFGVIDKLTVVGSLPRDSSLLFEHRLTNMRSENGVSVRHRTSHTGLYREIIIIRSKRNKFRMFRIEYDPRNHKAGYFRLELSPQHFGEAAMDTAVSWLLKRLGEPFVKFLNEAWVTRIDYAIDMWGWKLDDFWVRLYGSRLLTVTSIHEGKEESKRYRRHSAYIFDEVNEDRVGYATGSARSEIQVSVYDKPITHSELMEALELQFEFCSTVGSHNLSKITDCTRVEIRYRPSGGKHLFRHIHEVPDILSKVTVYPRYKVREVLSPALYDMLGTRTIFEMIASLPGDDKDARNLKNKLLRQLKKCESSDFFDREKVMVAWPQCVFHLGRLADVRKLTAEEAKALEKREKKLKRRLSAFSGGPGMSYDNYLS